MGKKQHGSIVKRLSHLPVEQEVGVRVPIGPLGASNFISPSFLSGFEPLAPFIGVLHNGSAFLLQGNGGGSIPSTPTTLGSKIWYNRTMPYKDPEKQKAAQRRYYDENKARYAAANKDRRNKLRQAIDAAKTGVPCMDCDIVYPPYIMDFDHRPGEVKLSNVSMLMNFASVEALMAEVAKCDIVCANCHRHRTWMRKQGSTSRILDDGNCLENSRAR